MMSCCSFLNPVCYASLTGSRFICDANNSVCHGIQGEPLYLQLVPNAIGYQVVLKKKTYEGELSIFRYRRDQIIFFNNSFSFSMKDRWDFTAKGAITINPAIKDDSGTYQVEIINEDEGGNVANNRIHIMIHGK